VTKCRRAVRGRSDIGIRAGVHGPESVRNVNTVRYKVKRQAFVVYVVL